MHLSDEYSWHQPQLYEAPHKFTLEVLLAVLHAVSFACTSLFKFIPRWFFQDDEAKRLSHPEVLYGLLFAKLLKVQDLDAYLAQVCLAPCVSVFLSVSHPIGCENQMVLVLIPFLWWGLILVPFVELDGWDAKILGLCLAGYSALCAHGASHVDPIRIGQHCQGPCDFVSVTECPRAVEYPF